MVRPRAIVTVRANPYSTALSDIMASRLMTIDAAEKIDRDDQAARIDISGRGERELAVATGDEVAEGKNRRVEISVR